MLDVYIDADACPVKQEVYRVAQRYGLNVILVANAWMNVPHAPWARLQVVGGKVDAADDWIADHVTTDDIVITADILLAARCLEQGALVLGTTGRPFDEDSIGDAVAARALMSELRDAGEMLGGPPPMTKKDRSRFLQRLDEMIQRVRRRA